MNVHKAGTARSDAIANALTHPPRSGDDLDATRTAPSLAKGALGVALLHAAHAQAGTGSPQTAHRWLNTITKQGVPTAPISNLYYGAPALAFVLSMIHGYREAKRVLRRQIHTITEQRLHTAHNRMRASAATRFGEYDVLAGLTGIGAHLLRSEPDSDLTHRVLTYLVDLSHPLPSADGPVVGWWVDHDPSMSHSPPFMHGHANLGLAHGVTGPLALLALAARAGITVAGHLEAIARISDWLESWRQPDPHSPFWPQWIKRGEAATGYRADLTVTRPSWCYGIPGIARALQLAGIALSDTSRQRTAERMLLTCLNNQAYLSTITDGGLCHGWAGILQATRRVAEDALTPGLSVHMNELTRRVLNTTPQDTAFLDGQAGTALALGDLSGTSWDACLLLT